MLEKVKPWSSIDATDDEVARGIVESELSFPEIVKEPAALSVTWTVFVPLASEKEDGSEALPSVEVSVTEFVTVVTRFQVLSQARTVTLNGTPTVWLWGAPLLPVPVPGAGDSPGSSTWSFV
jgi:hypothetical protein